MAIARHEEYTNHPGPLPFVLQPWLERTPHTHTREQNWHDDPELQLCLEGSGTVLLDGVRYSLSPGDVVVANPNVLHHTQTDQRLVYACLIINTAYCRQVGIDYRALQVASHIQDEALTTIFRELIEVYQQDDPWRVTRLHEVLLRLLLVLAQRYTTPIQTTIGSKHFETVKAVIGYIREHYRQRITLDKLAGAVYTDKFTLCRDFKRLTGQTIMDYTANFRCRAAAELIAAGHTVAEAAHQCGFDNPSFFTKTFKVHMGCLPSAYKKENP